MLRGCLLFFGFDSLCKFSEGLPDALRVGKTLSRVIEGLAIRSSPA
jgi:hypothetical protein